VELLGVLAVLGEAVGLVDLGGELGGEGVVQLAAGVVQQGGGVGEDLRVALDGGGLREDLNLAVAVDGEDGQVGELCAGEGVDVRGGDAVHDPVPSGRAMRWEEHTSELQSRENLVCAL